MKKRIRKKLYLGEFRRFGNVVSIRIEGGEEASRDVLDRFDPIIEEFGLNVAGGGAGRIIIPSKKGNKHIPTLVADIVTAVAIENPIDEMMFCVYMKDSATVPQAALEAIKGAFAAENVKISRSLDLWHTN